MRYNTQKMINRLDVYFQRKENKKTQLISYATIVSKICMEEFANPSSIGSNNKFLQKELKEALKLKMSEGVVDPETVRKSNIMIQELLQYKQLELAKNQLILKYFYERGGVDVEASENPKNNDKEMQDFLAQMASMGGEEPE